MRYIGDVHSKFDRYVGLLDRPSIQVGDFGCGFAALPDMPDHARFIRGNHDNPAICRQHPNWIADGTHEGDHFFCGGGHSIDQWNRTAGVDWWPDEELTMPELYGVLDAYEAARPRVMISHECPAGAAERLFGQQRTGGASRTSQALQAMLESHEPAIWIFGHWHRSVDRVLNGVRFICLAELEAVDLDG